MRNLLYSIIFVLFLAGCSRLPNSQQSSPSPSSTTADNCGITSCHGLDIQCGEDIPEVCTEEYQLGDFCRQFAKCEVVNGNCQLAENPTFASCKSCMQKCQQSSESMDAFDCEDTCIEEIRGPDYEG